MAVNSNFIRLIGRQKESGLTVKMFCSNEGITPSTFYYWQRKIRKEEGINRFIPLVVKSQPPQGITGRSEESFTGQPGEDIFFEIIYRNGNKLRLKHDLDIDRLRALLSLLD